MINPFQDPSPPISSILYARVSGFAATSGDGDKFFDEVDRLMKSSERALRRWCGLAKGISAPTVVTEEDREIWRDTAGTQRKGHRENP